MNPKPTIVSQYRAALAMLRSAVEQCPAEHWNDGAYTNRFWHVAYHALFFTDLYLCENEAAFVPWEKHITDYQYLGPLHWENNRMPAIGEPYGKADVLEYLGYCEGCVEARVEAANLEGPSGFFWLPFDKFELQIYNIRHIQHHAAQLIERVREHAGTAIPWVGSDGA